MGRERLKEYLEQVFPDADPVDEAALGGVRELERGSHGVEDDHAQLAGAVGGGHQPLQRDRLVVVDAADHHGIHLHRAEPGVERVLQLMQIETRAAMMQCGVRNVKELNKAFVAKF